MSHALRRLGGSLVVGLLAACSSETGTLTQQQTSSCMLCHNGSLGNDYSGPGIENPHPFPGASNLLCTDCHGGNGQGADQLTSHVPPPPQVGDRAFQTNNARAYFNRLTLAGMDKYPDYTVDGVTYTARACFGSRLTSRPSWSTGTPRTLRPRASNTQRDRE